MNIQKEISKIGVGITSSQAKKNVLNMRIDMFTKNVINKTLNELISEIEDTNKERVLTIEDVLNITKNKLKK